MSKPKVDGRAIAERVAVEFWADAQLARIFAEANGLRIPEGRGRTRCKDCGRWHPAHMECAATVLA